MWVNKAADPSYLVFGANTKQERFAALNGPDLEFQVDTVEKKRFSKCEERFECDQIGSGNTFFASKHSAIAANNAAAAAGLSHSNNLLLHNQIDDIESVKRGIRHLDNVIYKGTAEEPSLAQDVQNLKSAADAVDVRTANVEAQLNEFNGRLRNLDIKLIRILEYLGHRDETVSNASSDDDSRSPFTGPPRSVGF